MSHHSHKTKSLLWRYGPFHVISQIKFKIYIYDKFHNLNSGLMHIAPALREFTTIGAHIYEPLTHSLLVRLERREALIFQIISIARYLLSRGVASHIFHYHCLITALEFCCCFFMLWCCFFLFCWWWSSFQSFKYRQHIVSHERDADCGAHTDRLVQHLWSSTTCR